MRIVKITSEGLPDQFINTNLTNNRLTAELKLHRKSIEKFEAGEIDYANYDFVDSLVELGLAERVDFGENTFCMDY